jgi:hypothetical protein
VPDPGKGLASGDDTSAIAVNPANLAFLPDPELRWTWVWPSSASPLPARGHSVSLGMPLWSLATGLRIDFLDPPAAAPEPFDEAWRWVRWDIAARAGDMAAFGTTFGWGSSDALALDGHFSVTTGLPIRPSPMISLAAVARLGTRGAVTVAQLRAGRPAPRSDRGFEGGVEAVRRDQLDPRDDRHRRPAHRQCGDLTVRPRRGAESPRWPASTSSTGSALGGVFGDAFTPERRGLRRRALRGCRRLNRAS